MSSRWTIGLMATLAGAACSGYDGDAYPDSEAETDGAPPGSAPTTIQCATAALVDADGSGALRGKAARLTATAVDLGVALLVEIGPLFPHADSDPPTVTTDEVVDGAIALDHIALTWYWGVVEVDRAADGLWAGTAHLALIEPVAVTCWAASYTPRFRYVPASGLCVDDSGCEGRNPQAQAYVRDTGDGECVDLIDADLGEDVAYPTLRWNLAGARLDGAQLYFAQLVDTDLGAPA